MVSDMSTLEGKTALLTGAARRIGAVVAKTLHQAGANIVIHYRSSSEAAEQLVAELNHIREHSAFLIQADLCQIDQFDTLITQVVSYTGQLDILINNASSFFPTNIGTVTESQWDDLHCSNLKAPFFLSQAATPALMNTNGCIINMVDIHGFRPLKEHSVYSAAKAGLIMLTQSLARELAPKIRVNGVAPGAILWPEEANSDYSNSTMSTTVKPTNSVENSQEAYDALLKKTALKRQGTPEDIAKTILFLVKDAEYITGHVIPVDGGRLLNH